MSDQPRISACLAFDFDALSLWIGSFGADSPGVLSRGEFGAVAVPRILTLLGRHQARATLSRTCSATRSTSSRSR